ncbi:hypothetical protein CUN38_04930 [Enterococcus faecium]|nr:hypothetical protein CUN38_04930 [Enterococcus faecium]
MTLGMLLEVINECEFVTVFDANGDVIIEDCLNNWMADVETQPYAWALVDDVDTGISNSNGSLHTVIGITINEVI